MGFLVLMIFFTLLIPFIMVIFGRVFLKQSPKSINILFGYRTSRSMKNMETWKFAHKTLGKIWWICGIILSIVSVISMLLFIGDSKEIIGNVGSIIMVVQLIALFITVFYVEGALKKKFDDEGNPLN